MNTEIHNRISLETHPIGQTRSYEDKEGHIFAIQRLNLNHWKVRQNAFKNVVSADVPHGVHETYAHLVGYKAKKSAMSEILYLYLLK